LNKKFILSFLHAHGRLFTKIEIGFFFQIAGQLLREFTCLLRMSPLPLNSTRLVQLMAINMFTINHTEGTNLDPECQALLQNYALQLSFEMFRLLVDRATNLLRNHPIQELSNIPEDLNHLLPAIKVWCDWLIINESVWNRPRPVQITEFRN
uniref:DNA/RNA-binding domain-containing protein n=1 Tax=Strigamia maritima TaxID=126957 RepID=T1JNH7_STRMM